ncbi:MAG: hypothetical protein ACP5NG_01370 [Conexivisphaera sp.]
MSAGLRVRVRTSGGEVEIEVSDPSSVDAAIEAASRIMRELESRPAAPPAPEPAQQAPEAEAQQLDLAAPGELPALRVERGDSLADVIRKMFASEWGSRPRRLSEIMGVLESHGLIYPKSSVAVALLRLARDGDLRRFKEGGEYVYIRREPVAGGEA